MDRKDYHRLKRYIKTLCIDNVKDLANNVGLTEYETKLLVYVNKNDTRVHMSLELGVCESKLTKDLRKIFVKVQDYLKRQS